MESKRTVVERRHVVTGTMKIGWWQVCSGYIRLGCVFQDTELPESLSILRKNPTVLGSTRRVRSTKAAQRRANIREKGPPLGKNSADRRIIFIFFEHQETHDFLQMQADQASQGEQAALTKISEAEYHTRLLLEEQKKPLSEARSETNMQESRVESADRAGSPWIKAADSFSTHGTLPGESVIWSLPERERALE